MNEAVQKDHRRPTKIGKYLVESELGRGAFGIVYRGRHTETGEVVAIKSISIRRCSKEQVEAVLTEINLLKQLKSEYIVRYVGHKRTKKKLYIYIEFVPGGSLQDLLRRQPPPRRGLPEAKVCQYVYQILRALEYTHSEGVIHRDIKGANILIDENDGLKLADFGVASDFREDADTNPAGTPYWMAPEVIEFKYPNPASDIWSVGATAVELLTGSPPYFDLPTYTALYRIAQDTNPPIPTNVDISESCVRFLLQCFERDVKKRPSATDLLQERWFMGCRADEAAAREAEGIAGPETPRGRGLGSPSESTDSLDENSGGSQEIEIGRGASDSHRRKHRRHHHHGSHSHRGSHHHHHRHSSKSHHHSGSSHRHSSSRHGSHSSRHRGSGSGRHRRHHRKHRSSHHSSSQEEVDSSQSQREREQEQKVEVVSPHDRPSPEEPDVDDGYVDEVSDDSGPEIEISTIDLQGIVVTPDDDSPLMLSLREEDNVVLRAEGADYEEEEAGEVDGLQQQRKIMAIFSALSGDVDDRAMFQAYEKFFEVYNDPEHFEHFERVGGVSFLIPFLGGTVKEFVELSLRYLGKMMNFFLMNKEKQSEYIEAGLIADLARHLMHLVRNDREVRAQALDLYVKMAHKTALRRVLLENGAFEFIMHVLEERGEYFNGLDMLLNFTEDEHIGRSFERELVRESLKLVEIFQQIDPKAFADLMEPLYKFLLSSKKLHATLSLNANFMSVLKSMFLVCKDPFKRFLELKIIHLVYQDSPRPKRIIQEMYPLVQEAYLHSPRGVVCKYSDVLIQAFEQHIKC